MATEKPKRAPFFFDVAADTPARTCDHCPATIYFVRTTTGKRMPVRCDVPEGKAPTATEPGRGLSHFADCPGANRARRGR